jgi:outer membrane protein assembly factor BamB
MSSLDKIATILLVGGVSAPALPYHSPPFRPESSFSAGLTQRQAQRPFRLNFLKFDPELDWLKPLALSDASGFIVNSEVLIGQVANGLVGGLSLSAKQVIWTHRSTTNMTAPIGNFGSWVVCGFRDGTVKKIEALTGSEVWSQTLTSFTDRGFLLAGTTLFVLTGAQVLYALDFQTGEILWLFDAGFPDGLTVRGAAKPIVHDGKIIFGVASGELLSVSGSTGKLGFRYNPAYIDGQFHDVVGEMVVQNNQLIVSRYDGLLASINIGSSSREVTWESRLPGVTTSKFRGGRFYVGALNGDLMAFNIKNGKRIFRQPTGSPLTTITVGETSIFTSGSDGQITAVDQASGRIRWHDNLGSPVVAPPVLFEDVIYYTTSLRNAYGYRIH